MRTAWTHRLAAGAIAALTGLALGAVGAAAADTPLSLLVNRSIDGRANNLQHPSWGQAGVPYRRVAPANYADGRSQQVTPVKGDRYVSNRIFNDVNQNVFSENGVSQWGCVWGQFMDHTFGLRGQKGAAIDAASVRAPSDPLESFSSDLRSTSPARRPRTAPACTTRASSSTRSSSYIDGSSVYGDSASRLDWLREGSVDGDPANNSARLLLPDGYLPAPRRPWQRGDGAATDLTAASPGSRTRPWSPVTCAPTRTSRSRAPRRSSPASTTGSSRPCRPSCPTSRSSRSPGGWWVPSSSSSPTTSSSRAGRRPRPVSRLQPQRRTPRSPTSSPPSATGRTA